ncbi:MAG: polysaccharide pyruvyl transferase family protein [Bacteroidales bacterium]|nr:polysaccharide pyruvyl transferase family protein [Bacteroidales bacterium]
MDRILSWVVRGVIVLSGWMRPLSRLGLVRYDEWHPGAPLRILLVGYNGARNTGADARVVALVRQIEDALGDRPHQLSVMTLSRENLAGYFSPQVQLVRVSSLFFFTLLRAASTHHVAVLCEGSTLTRTFADALTLFFCEAAGIMRRQGKPCIAYGSEVGQIDGWLARVCSTTCRDTHFMVRTQPSLQHLQQLGLRGHLGTDTAWPFTLSDGGAWARERLMADGWDGVRPLLGVAVVNPFCWPVRPSLWRWARALLTGDHRGQYDLMYFFADGPSRRQQFQHYISQVATAVNDWSRRTGAMVVLLGMEQLDAEACQLLAGRLEGPHALYTSRTHDVYQMTGLLRQLDWLVTSRYHAAVLSMPQAVPVVAVSMDGRLDGLMQETGLSADYLHHVDDVDLGARITRSLTLAQQHREQVRATLRHHLVLYNDKVNIMSRFFIQWINQHIS